MDLTPWIIAWAVVTTAVLALGYYRVILELQGDPSMHLYSVEGNQSLEQATLERKIYWVDRCGQALTIASVILVVAIAMMWASGLGAGTLPA